jgi:hypothetical protein
MHACDEIPFSSPPDLSGCELIVRNKKGDKYIIWSENPADQCFSSAYQGFVSAGRSKSNLNNSPVQEFHPEMHFIQIDQY